MYIGGIFANTGLVALWVLTYFNENKINVPEQVAIIGFSNWFTSQVLILKLSTVHRPGNEMGIESFNLLLKEINCHKDKIPLAPRTIELKTTVIGRESSMRFK